MTAPDLEFEGYHNRTSSRFGGHVNIRVDDERVTVTGRRVGRTTRGFWLAAQAVVMALLIALFFYALVAGGLTAWAWFAAALVVLWIGSSLGALLIWWPADLGERGFVWLVAGSRRAHGEEAAAATYTTLELPRSAISAAAHTKWYSRRGLWLVSWPWQLLALLGPDTAVVFDAEDPDRAGHVLVFALTMESEVAAAGLARALQGSTTRSQ